MIEAIDRQRRVQVAQRLSDIYAGRRRLDQERWVDRRLEEGQLTDDAREVHAVADLVTTGRPRCPRGRAAIVVGDAEVQHVQEGQFRRIWAHAGGDGRRGQQVFDLGQRIAEGVDAVLLQLIEGLDGVVDRAGNALGPRTEQSTAST